MKHVSRLAMFVPVLASVLAAATLNLSPSSSSVLTGETFMVDVNIVDVVDLYAYQFNIGFDPAVLNASAVAAGPFLSLGGPTFFIEGVSDNAAGVLSATAESLQSAVPGVSGNGTLARITFVAVGQGSAVVSPFEVLLLDSSLFGIETSATDATIEISGVPEPSGAGLIACALVLVWIRTWIVRHDRTRIL